MPRDSSSSQPLTKAPTKGRNKQALALDCIGTLGRLAALFVERRKQLAEGVGLTDQQWQVLEEVQDEHFMPSLFAQRRESSAAAVSKILRQLNDKGLITASVSNKDARQRQYTVTKKGTRVIETLREERQRAIERVWLELSSKDLATFADLGGSIADRLERIASGPIPDTNRPTSNRAPARHSSSSAPPPRSKKSSRDRARSTAK